LTLEIDNSILNLKLNGSTLSAPPGSGPYLPVWQVSPIVPMKSVLNFNVLSHQSGKGAFEEVICSGQAVVNFADNLNKEHLGGAYFKLLLSMSQYPGEIELFLGEPETLLGYPVFDLLDPITQKVVGLLNTVIYWKIWNQHRLGPGCCKLKINVTLLISKTCCPPMQRESSASFPTHGIKLSHNVPMDRNQHLLTREIYMTPSMTHWSSRLMSSPTSRPPRVLRPKATARPT
jgi:hypothetical protein